LFAFGKPLVRRSKWSTGPFRLLRKPLLTLERPAAALFVIGTFADGDGRVASSWRGSTITLLICETGVARFPSSGGFAPALPQPRSSSAFAADSRAPAGASVLFMISARTAMASALWARARD